MGRIVLLFWAFTLSLPQDAANTIRFQGKWNIGDREAVDLDVGDSGGIMTRIDGPDEPFREPPMSFKGSDFWYEFEYKFQRLNPQHGARLARGRAAEAGLAGCSKATYAKGTIRIDDLPVGSHICVHTNEGRYSEMRIEEFDRKRKSFSFTYSTWKKDASDPVAPRY
jgi:hypothetical protein